MTEKNFGALRKEQQQVIEELISGKSRLEAAEESGVTVDDIRDWQKNDTLFVATLNQEQQDLYRDQTERFRSLAGEAISAIEALLTSENESVKLRAAALVMKTVGLAEIKKPSGHTTVEDVEASRQRDELFDSLLKF